MTPMLVALRLQILSDGGGSAFGDAGSMVGGTVVDSTVISDRQFKVLGKLASGGEGQDDEKLNLHLRIQQPEGECGCALPRSGGACDLEHLSRAFLCHPALHVSSCAAQGAACLRLTTAGLCVTTPCPIQRLERHHPLSNPMLGPLLGCWLRHTLNPPCLVLQGLPRRYALSLT